MAGAGVIDDVPITLLGCLFLTLCVSPPTTSHSEKRKRMAHETQTHARNGSLSAFSGEMCVYNSKTSTHTQSHQHAHAFIIPFCFSQEAILFSGIDWVVFWLRDVFIPIFFIGNIRVVLFMDMRMKI